MDFKRTRPIQRGDIYYADLTPVTGSEQGGIRPVLILQNVFQLPDMTAGRGVFQRARGAVLPSHPFTTTSRA